MTIQPKEPEGSGEPADIEESQWVLSALEADQLVRAKRSQLPRKRITGVALGVMWLLRLYLLFMLIVIAYQVLHGQSQ
jgi:hypothetical protein